MAAKKGFTAAYPSQHTKAPKPEKAPPPPGPTKNLEYNQCFATWNDKGVATHIPECEMCGCDLTNQPVHDIELWVCTGCKEKSDFVAPLPVDPTPMCKVCSKPLSPSEIGRKRVCRKCNRDATKHIE